jgi:hypothetical protein
MSRLATVSLLATFSCIVGFAMAGQKITTPAPPVNAPPASFAQITPDLDAAGWTKLFPEDSLKGWKHNCTEETWSLKDGILACSGDTNGGLMSRKVYRNFEIAFEWQHQRHAGNAGIFLWVTGLPEKGLPTGIEVQILDLGYAENWEKSKGSKPDWFTCHGDVFPCGPSKMKPFPPAAPNGARSFPTAETTRPFGQWNRYYIRCLNGELRLWVNGQEVSGGTACTPAQGPIAFEAEGAPVLYRDIWIRELP